MIDLTPLEVRQKKGDFRRAFRGYDAELVNDFLDLVADRMEELVKENMAFRDQVETLQAELGEYRDKERALSDALMTAQRLREDAREHAEKEGRLLIREAKMAAEEARHEANRQLAREEETLRQVRARRSQLVSSFRRLLERELGELGVIEETLELEAKRATARDAAIAPAGPADEGPADAEVADAEVADAEVADAEVADAEPAVPEGAGAEVVDAEPVSSEPMDGEPAEAQPVEPGLAAAEPEETHLVEAPPRERAAPGSGVGRPGFGEPVPGEPRPDEGRREGPVVEEPRPEERPMEAPAPEEPVAEEPPVEEFPRPPVRPERYPRQPLSGGRAAEEQPPLEGLEDDERADLEEDWLRSLVEERDEK